MQRFINAVLQRARSRHPRWRRTYHATVYAPMRGLMAHLRAHGSRTFIVAGGETDYLRTCKGPVYGGPPGEMIGASGHARLAHRRVGAAKRTDIALRPLFAAAEADSRLQMLQYATARPGRPMALLVHHGGAAREYVCDRHSKLGALHEAAREGRSVVSMKADWRKIFLPTATPVGAL